ncbi:ABC transporter permease [Occultella kanbiaonis]|uniref:ABC transporter permease n=1 Tax=Occultella kanbiaonis TaxID=2675754 RepID=UPI0012B931AF|nr:ABC transporter permease subunit [Occultella kanbiaonis]
MSTLTGAAAQRRRRSPYRRYLPLILIFLPGFIIFMVFAYGPLPGIIIAFKNFSVIEGIWGSDWAGLDNFRRLFAGADFGQAIRNTLVLAGLDLIIVFPAPIVLALLLNELRWNPFKRLVQTLSYLPHFISWVVLASILFQFLGSAGPVNAFLGLFGIDGQPWLLQSQWFYVIYVVSKIWATVGWGAIIYIAALAGIDPTLHEAARMDGANRWQQIRHVTLPGIAPTVAIMFLLSLSSFLAVGFDQVYNLTTPSTQQVADIIDTYVLRQLLSFDFSLSMAASVFQAVVGLTLVLLGNWVTRRIDPERSLF